MKRTLDRRRRVCLALGVMSVMSAVNFAPVRARPADDDAPAPGPLTPAMTVSRPAATGKTTWTAVKTEKMRIAAKATRRRTTARTTTAKTGKAGAAKAAKATGRVNVPAIFYDKEWSYRTATLYGKDKNIVSSVSGEAKFDRNGKYRQDYYIGGIGNFFKGTYKIQGDHLITYDEKGKKIFDFKFTVGTNPPILVLTLLEKDGSKSIDYSLVPLEKNKKQ